MSRTTSRVRRPVAVAVVAGVLAGTVATCTVTSTATAAPDRSAAAVGPDAAGWTGSSATTSGAPACPAPSSP